MREDDTLPPVESESERRSRQWRRLAAGDMRAVAEMSVEDARAALARIKVSPGDNPAARRALEARLR